MFMKCENTLVVCSKIILLSDAPLFTCYVAMVIRPPLLNVFHNHHHKLAQVSFRLIWEQKTLLKCVWGEKLAQSPRGYFG